MQGPSLQMLIYGLREHFPLRFSEWANAGILSAWGIYLILHPDLFKDNNGLHLVYAQMSDMVWLPANPESVWGLSALLVGLLRLTALFINGAYSRTPAIRLATAAFSAFVWTQVVIGLSHVPNVSIVVYSGLVVVDLVSAYRAGQDAAIAQKLRKHRRTGVEGVDSTRIYRVA